jgi:hypothetical protein
MDNLKYICTMITVSINEKSNTVAWTGWKFSVKCDFKSKTVANISYMSHTLSKTDLDLPFRPRFCLLYMFLAFFLACFLCCPCTFICLFLDVLTTIDFNPAFFSLSLWEWNNILPITILPWSSILATHPLWSGHLILELQNLIHI